MTFAIGDRVVLLDTPHNREGGQVGESGEIAGISFEHEDHRPHVGYAVSLDKAERAYFVLPDGLSQTDREVPIPSELIRHYGRHEG